MYYIYGLIITIICYFSSETDDTESFTNMDADGHRSAGVDGYQVILI